MDQNLKSPNKSRVLLCVLLAFITFCSYAQKKKKNKDADAAPKTTSPIIQKGFFDFEYDESNGKVFLYVDRLNEEFIYVSSLSSGLGSNDIGLDRGQLKGTKVVKFIKAGNKLLLIEPNYDYRAISDNPDEIQAVEEAFARSVIAGFKIDQKKTGRLRIDITDFIVRDSHEVVKALKRSKQGNYKLDKNRSAVNITRTKNFPNNTDFDAILTFSGDAQGGYVRSVTPTSSAITVNVHHSFVKAPAPGFEMRAQDPRAGFFGISFMDYATPISEPIRKRYISRHRLAKKDPNAAVSEPVKPIVYYLDRGAPEPIRSALLDGASWWNQAFEAAGYKDAFRVEVLPDSIDPMDIRYNMIQWVHRSTRGWSYGGGVIDPRTGEIIKGHVSLGSLRVRQDFLIAQGLLSPYKEDNTNSSAMEGMALARLRQLSAHEVGHTLGLAHSYASSTEGRASVMDYPHPYVQLVDGKINLDNAYDNKIGAWDKVSITWGYSDFADGVNEKEALNKIISDAGQNGLSFLSDQDARPRGSSHPFAHLWDNGRKPHEELNRIMEIRKVAINNMGENSIPAGTPYATLEEVLVPIYYFHRYQIEAAAKLIGGMNYRYAIKGDGQLVTEYVPAVTQLGAVDALLATVQPDALALPDELLKVIPPRPLGYWRSNELIKNKTGLNFDPVAAAETAAEMTFSLLMHPQRLARVVEHNARNNNLPGFEMIMNRVLKATLDQKEYDGYKGEIQNVINQNFLDQLMRSIVDPAASLQVRAYALQTLKKSLTTIESKSKRAGISRSKKAFYTLMMEKIRRFYERPQNFEPLKALDPPAGSPIGMDKFCGVEH